MSVADPDALRAAIRERWDRAAGGWGKRTGEVREAGMPVSVWMIERLELQPGQRVLELAAGPGDTGFLAAELIAPSGVLLCSDASGAMLDLARARAEQMGVRNVEFKQLELEWVDLPTASVDAALCRWGFMFCVDVAAAMREVRRVLRPGGRLALAVWDGPEHNPWATIPSRALVSLGLAEPADPDAPGMFALAPVSKLRGKLEEAGFVESVVETVDVPRRRERLSTFLEETLDLSQPFAETWAELDERQRAAAVAEMEAAAGAFLADDGSLDLPGRSIVALANA